MEGYICKYENEEAEIKTRTNLVQAPNCHQYGTQNYVEGNPGNVATSHISKMRRKLETHSSTPLRGNEELGRKTPLKRSPPAVNNNLTEARDVDTHDFLLFFFSQTLTRQTLLHLFDGHVLNR